MGQKGSEHVVFVAVPLPGTALHAPGPSSVHRELPLPGRSPAAVRLPTGAGAARPRSEPPPGACSSSEDGCLGMFGLIFCFSVPSFADESSEVQTQICNGFKSLVVQLQGELPGRTEGQLSSLSVGFHLPPSVRRNTQ